jgi:hypothetical protein
MDRTRHWDDVYANRRANEVSWFQRRPALSLELIERLGLPADAACVDVGGGASTLVDELAALGWSDLTVLDVSSRALDVARARLAAAQQPAVADGVHWVCADVTTWVPQRSFDLWHDRAVFHFLVDPEDRGRYRDVLAEAVTAGGHAVMATFADDGPTTCSGLTVRRYSAESLVAEMGEGFELTEARRELHRTPAGVEQPFTWVVLRRR